MPKRKKIERYDHDTDELLETFASIRDAERENEEATYDGLMYHAKKGSVYLGSRWRVPAWEEEKKEDTADSAYSYGRTIGTRLYEVAKMLEHIDELISLTGGKYRDRAAALFAWKKELKTENELLTEALEMYSKNAGRSKQDILEKISERARA